MSKVLSVSATIIMMGIMMITGADVQQDQEQIQPKGIIKEAAVLPVQQEKEQEPEGELMPRTHTVHVYTKEDADLMKKVAIAEGGIDGPDSMWMIMSVIINRTNDPDYPDSVSGVVWQKNAFSCLKDGNFDKAPDTTPECEEAFARIEAGDIAPQIIAFEGIKSNVLDQWFREAFTFRHHKFYTKK